MSRSFYFLILSFTLALNSCANAQSEFPDVVDVKKTSEFKRVKGTKFFAKIPANYMPMEELTRMQKDNNTYFQVIELVGSDFISNKQAFSRGTIEEKGAKVTVHKSIKYSGYDAIYVEGPSKKEGETKLGIIFGTNSFTVMITGVCSDDAGKEELKMIFKNSTYDESFHTDPLELASFSFNESITGFKYAAAASNFYVYTLDGDPVDVNGETRSNFTVSSLPVITFDKAKEFLNDIFSRHEGDWKDIHNVKKRETVINGRKAYEITFDATENGRDLKVYEVVLVDETSAFIFAGADYDNRKYIDKFVATAGSLSKRK